jgi:hypothetical protein
MPTQLSYRRLDCPASGPCPVVRTISNSSPMLPDKFSKATGLPAFGDPCPAGPPVGATSPQQFPVDARANDAVLARTKSGRIIQALLHTRRSAPTFPEPIWGAPPGNGLQSLDCNNSVSRVGIMLHKNDACGNTFGWKNSFIDLDGMVRPDGSVFHFERPVDFSLFGVPTKILKTRDKQGNVYGTDRPEIYADPFTGAVFITARLIFPDSGGGVTGADVTQILLMSVDDGDHWRIAAEVPGSGVPLVMTSTQVGGMTKLFLVAAQSANVDGVPRYLPYVSWYDISGGFLLPLGGAPVYYQGPDGPVETSAVALEETSLSEFSFSRGANNITVARAQSDESLSRIRVAYPSGTNSGPGLEEVYVVQVAVPTSNPSGLPCGGGDCRVGLANIARIGANLGISAIFPHFIEPNFVDQFSPTAGDPHPNGALLKFIERPIIPIASLTQRPAVIGFYDNFGVTSTITLTSDYRPSAPWAGSACTSSAQCGGIGVGTCSSVPGAIENRCIDFVGDYAYGAFFTRPADRSIRHFIVPWQEANLSNPVPQGRDRVLVQEVAW